MWSWEKQQTHHIRGDGKKNKLTNEANNWPNRSLQNFFDRLQVQGGSKIYIQNWDQNYHRVCEELIDDSFRSENCDIEMLVRKVFFSFASFDSYENFSLTWKIKNYFILSVLRGGARGESRVKFLKKLKSFFKFSNFLKYFNREPPLGF